MTDYINIGSTPAEEDCFPAGHPKARRETLIYRNQLRREFPAAIFEVKAFPHDFGTYHEVVAILGVDPDSNEAAYAAEADAAGEWDEESKRALKALGRDVEVRF